MNIEPKLVDSDNPVAVAQAISALELDLRKLEPELFVKRQAAATLKSAADVLEAQAYLRARGDDGNRFTENYCRSWARVEEREVINTSLRAHAELSSLTERARLLERRISALQSILKTHAQLAA
jgi:hypothetical protein